jgi:speckle-type POZ protein
LSRTGRGVGCPHIYLERRQALLDLSSSSINQSSGKQQILGQPAIASSQIERGLSIESRATLIEEKRGSRIATRAMAAIHSSSSKSPAGGVKTMSTMEIFTVSRYSRTSRTPTGQALKSKPFDFHARSWRIKVYPTGVDHASTDFVSIFLKCRTEPFHRFDATIAMEITDKTGEKVVFDGATAASALAAADDGVSKGYAMFARRRELEVSECMDDDGFTIRITLQVVGAKSPKPSPFHMLSRVFAANNKQGGGRRDNGRRLPAPPSETSPAPLPATTSGAETEVVTGSHKLVIDHFSRKKSLLGSGECVRSCQFSVGGSSWYVKVYPNGYGDADRTEGVCFVLARGRSADQECSAEFTFHVEGLDPSQGSIKSDTVTHAFGRASAERLGYHTADLQPAIQMRHDVLVVQIGLGVFRGAPPSALLAGAPALAVPPRDTSGALWLLKSEEGSDVTFAVGDTTFRAHAGILAAASPALRAELREDANLGAWRYVEVDSEAVTPDAFEALLHVAYTDHLPDMHRLEPTDQRVGDLVLAADRYEMDRLRVRTEEWVFTFVNAYTVADFLSMAVRYDCQMLRDACVQFATPDHIWKIVKETDGFERLRASCPQIVREIESKQRQY